MSIRTRTQLAEVLDELYDSALNGMCRILAVAWVLAIPAIAAAFTRASASRPVADGRRHLRLARSAADRRRSGHVRRMRTTAPGAQTLTV